MALDAIDRGADPERLALVCGVPVPERLCPPDGLAAARFRLGSEEFLLLSFDAPDDPIAPPNMLGLRSSERTVACLALAGLSNSHVAQIAPNVARHHRQSADERAPLSGQAFAPLYRKLGLGSRRELKAYCSQSRPSP